MADDKPFNNPFSGLRGLKIPKKQEPARTPPGERQAPPPPDTPAPVNEDDSTLYTKAMEGVRPLENDRIVPEHTEKESIAQQVREKALRQDKEVMDTLNALVSGRSGFDITCTGEYLEGNIIALDPRVLKQLKSGEYTIQAHLDLHGYVQESAKAALTNFVQNCHAMGYRSLLVIHGRGLKSDIGPVLKEGVVKWLTTGTLAHLVLAFCSARPCDGGTGALYVLLKKRPVKSPFRSLL